MKNRIQWLKAPYYSLSTNAHLLILVIGAVKGLEHLNALRLPDHLTQQRPRLIGVRSTTEPDQQIKDSIAPFLYFARHRPLTTGRLLRTLVFEGCRIIGLEVHFIYSGSSLNPNSYIGPTLKIPFRVPDQNKIWLLRSYYPA
ncbi:hypothetical protein [Phaeodactylibacter xiamenensis]|uniref:hypothetical protein n=1 Tax=Phaeodactylibacter xiamenensis TaxID=1524460 RepID=UPI0024A94968|nr:hypothetical protein [Phaeodactylibacter xiamenensis]